MATRVFALLIGIDSYKSGSVWNLHSCTEDVDRVNHWLVDELKVPPDQIHKLLDSQATKQRIEDAFMDHLVNNPCIEKGDAIVIYFAGHGSSTMAPEGWFEDSSTGDVQMLCTYDFDTKSPQGRITGISDRSFHAMIAELSAFKGNNITVILDCCFSSPSDILERRNTRWTPTFKAVSDDLYRGLWNNARNISYNSKLGFLNSKTTTHTLLAACGPGQQAAEDKSGGKFTSSLLHALRELPLHRTTYAQLIDHLLFTTSDVQQFFCVGQLKQRNLFNDVAFPVDNRFSSATLDLRTGLMKVEVGTIHGVMEGTEFSLHLHNHRHSRNPMVATLVATEIHPTFSFGRPKSPSETLPKSCFARITKWNNRRPFRVYLKSTITSFFKTWRLRRTLPTKPGSAPPTKGGLNVLRVKHPDLADISLKLRYKGVDVTQHNPLLTHKHDHVVRIPDKNGSEVIDEAARFNLHLLRKNNTNPLGGQVQMELYRLDPTTWNKVGPNFMKNGIATVPYEKGAIYSITIRNNSKYDLWPYLMYMDPHTYGITTLYHPDLSLSEPPLKKQGRLEIGSGKPQSEALSFALEESNQHDSGFLKLFLSSVPVPMHVLEHSANPDVHHDFFGFDQKFSTPASAYTKPAVWDTDLASIAFTRHAAAASTT
ncbi:caspase domain-containing protein [Panaeolus papilionaceus]|nr:caspase domain-containing protein [Panaeolus papilionaceus]